MANADSTVNLDGATKRVLVAMFLAMIVDGMALQVLALALPSIMKDLNLSNIVGGSLATWTLAGMGVGGILGGWLSDRVGRMRVCFWCLILFTLFTAFIAGCNTYWQITFCRFVAGAGVGAVYGVTMTMVAEFVPTKWRATTLGIMLAGWSLGYVVASAVSAYVLPAFGWRALFLTCIPPAVITMVLMIGLKDSPSYELSRAAKAEAAKAGKGTNEFAKIWADKPVRNVFIAWSFTTIALQFGYYGANIWLPSYLVTELGLDLKSMGWFIAATYVSMTLGKAGAGFLADRLGRRITWLLTSLGTAIVLPLAIHYATPDNIVYLLLIVGLLCGAPMGVTGAYMSESFPTAVRGTGLSTAYNMGRIGSMAAPMMIGLVSAQYSIAFGIALLGVGYLICGLIPPLFIGENIFDPQAVASDSSKN